MEGYKKMIIRAKSGPSPSFLPIVYTDKISGVNANFLRERLEKNGFVESEQKDVTEDFSSLDSHDSKAWKDIWSAGHGEQMNIQRYIKSLE